MNETQEVNSEQGAVSGAEINASSVSVAQPVSTTQSPAPSEVKESTIDSVAESGSEVPTTVVKESVPTIISSGGVSVGDIWSNEETSFRVDEVTSVGGVNIRFRTRDTLEGSKSSFIRKARALFVKKERLPHGEWFFGSGEEIRQFIEQNGYRLEKRREEEQEPVKTV